MMGTDASILLVGPNGEPFGKLRGSVLSLVDNAEELARRESKAKARALLLTLKTHVENAGYTIAQDVLEEGVRRIQQIRHGTPAQDLALTVRAVGSPGGPDAQIMPTRSPIMARGEPPGVTPPAPSTGTAFFEAERQYPDDDAHAWYQSLKGLEEQKHQLLLELELLLYPDRLVAWSKRHHGGTEIKLCASSRSRVPLVLLEGDVGTGKTALAETIGDALARRADAQRTRRVHLLKINTQVRGSGLVGEMSDLIVQAFAQAEARARSLNGEPMLLLLDEADALASSRDAQQMHHEDKAGLNTILQRLDNLRPTRLPIAVLFITNRPASLDPAVRRRAALVLRFDRPGDDVRAEIIRSAVPELELPPSLVDKLVQLTSSKDPRNQGVPFTGSDLTERLLPSAVRAAYAADRALRGEDLLHQASSLVATPPFGGHA